MKERRQRQMYRRGKGEEGKGHGNFAGGARTINPNQTFKILMNYAKKIINQQKMKAREGKEVPWSNKSTCQRRRVP